MQLQSENGAHRFATVDKCFLKRQNARGQRVGLNEMMTGCFYLKCLLLLTKKTERTQARWLFLCVCARNEYAFVRACMWECLTKNVTSHFGVPRVPGLDTAQTQRWGGQEEAPSTALRHECDLMLLLETAFVIGFCFVSNIGFCLFVCFCD